MPELCYLDGRFLPLADAAVSPEDRGYNFGDGIYEVLRVYRGVPFALAEHLDRLEASAAAIGIPLRHTRAAYAALIRDLVARSGLEEAYVYGQVTRGVAPRSHVYDDAIEPVDFWYARAIEDKASVRERGQSLIAVVDDRWSRCHIKAISLLPNILAKNLAVRAGALEALFMMPDTRIVTEGSASNLFAVRDGVVFTHPIAGGKVLPGVTRRVMLELAAGAGIEVVEEGRTLEFFLGADEVILTSTTMEVVPIGKIDGTTIRDGRPGPVTRRLQAIFRARVEEECGGGGHRMGAATTGRTSDPMLRAATA